MIRRPPRSTLSSSSAASDVYKRQFLLRERTAVGKWRPKKHPCFLPLQRSHFEPLADGLTGPTGISPVQSSAIRSQDEPPWKLSISASFRILPDPSKTSYVSGIALRRDERPIPSRATRHRHRQLRADPHLSGIAPPRPSSPRRSMPVLVRSRSVRKPLVLNRLATVAGSAAARQRGSAAAIDRRRSPVIERDAPVRTDSRGSVGVAARHEHRRCWRKCTLA